MRISTISRICLLSLIALATACGGESRPGPLEHTIDEMFIAKVPLSQKQDVLQAQNEFAAAKMKRAEIDAEYGETATELSIAENEQEQAKLDEKSVEARKKAAEESADMNRVNTVAREMRAAKLATQAAEAKVKYVKARRKYLRQKLFQAEDEMYAAEAQFELEKARVAQANNIRPKGFEAGNFERQATERSKHAQRTKALLERERGEMEKARSEWQALKKEATSARGN
ncbi:MAG: hypothetical protein Tsb0020_35970 [Haliangiales bacterium]